MTTDHILVQLLCTLKFFASLFFCTQRGLHSKTLHGAIQISLLWLLLLLLYYYYYYYIPKLFPGGKEILSGTKADPCLPEKWLQNRGQ